MFELVGLVSFLVAASLIWRRDDVAASQRAQWSFLGLLGLLLPPLVFVLLEVIFPRSPLKLILVPFMAIAELAVPWIAFAIFNDRFPKPQAADPIGPEKSSSDVV